MSAAETKTTKTPEIAEMTEDQIKMRIITCVEMLAERNNYPVGSAKRHVLAARGLRLCVELFETRNGGNLGESSDFYMEQYAIIASAIASNLRAQVKRNNAAK